MPYDVTSTSEVRRSIGKLSDNSGVYIAHARKLRRQEAELLVENELRRIAASRQMSPADRIARIVVIVLSSGVLISALLFIVGFIVK
jgi:hypothetical protein